VLIVRSPVRISFAGGGTDLPAYFEQYGGAVLSTAINKYFYTILGRRSDDLVQIISSDLRVFGNFRDFDSMHAEGELQIPVAVLKYLHSSVAMDLFLASEIPPGTGLGSSASVCVNILKAIATFTNKTMSKHDLAETAFHIARNVLQRHVGKQDEYAAAFGGINFISFRTDGSTDVRPVPLEDSTMQELQSNLVLFFTGSAHHSWTILEEQENSTRDHRGTAVAALHQVRALADEMCEVLCAGNLTKFGALLHKGWEAKKQISQRISNSRIDHLYQLARQHGAGGGKITGAGGGGFLLLYCEPQYQAAVRSALADEGIREMAFAFDFQGAQTIVNDPFIDGDKQGGPRWKFLMRSGTGVPTASSHI
jgi:D-glycero-alpha-D-manno-heptose-7-phosphate kinase